MRLLRRSASLVALSILTLAAGCSASPDEAAPTTLAENAQDEAIARLDTARARLRSASDKMRGGGDDVGAEGMLHRELVQVGPALDGTQQAAFAKAFWATADHQAVMDEYFAAARALSDELAALIDGKNADALRTTLASSMKEEAKIENSAFTHRRDVFFDAATALASTPLPYVALRIGGLLLAADHFEEDDPIRQFVKLRRDEVDGFDTKVKKELVVQPLLPSAIQIAIEQQADPAGVVAALASAVNDVRRGYGAYELVRGGELAGLFDALDAVVKDQAAGALEGVSPKALLAGEKVDGLDRAAQGIATFLAVWDTGAAIKNGDIEAFVQTTPGAIAGIADLTMAVRRVTLGVANAETPFLKAAATYAGKLAAGIGVVTSAVALVQSIDANDGTLSDTLHIIGDAATLGAAIAALAGVSVAAPVFIAVALGAHYLGGVLKQLAIESEMAADIKDALASVEFPLSGGGVDIRSILVTADPKRIAGLSGDVGLDATQIQKVILLCSGLVSKVVAPRDLGFYYMGMMRREFGMNGTQMFGLFDAVKSSGGSPGSATLRVFQLALSFDGLAFGGLDPGATRCDRWRSWLKQERERDDVYFAAPADRIAWQKGIDGVLGKLPGKCAPEPED